MGLRIELEKVFEGKAFVRPLFYGYPGGIRLELSEGGSAVHQFLTAMGKAQRVCDSVFKETEELTVVLCAYAYGSRFGFRRRLQALRRAGVRVPRDRELWVEMEAAPEGTDTDEPNAIVRIAFRVPKRLLAGLLWCALAQDLGIEPNPGMSIYLADLHSRVLVFPYDDRGMDIVGPDHERLAAIYSEFRALALEYDRAVMDVTFGSGPMLRDMRGTP